MNIQELPYFKFKGTNGKKQNAFPTYEEDGIDYLLIPACLSQMMQRVTISAWNRFRPFTQWKTVYVGTTGGVGSNQLMGGDNVFCYQVHHPGLFSLEQYLTVYAYLVGLDPEKEWLLRKLHKEYQMQVS